MNPQSNEDIKQAIRAAGLLVSDVKNDVKRNIVRDFPVGVAREKVEELFPDTKNQPKPLIEFLARTIAPGTVPQPGSSEEYIDADGCYSYRWLENRNTQLPGLEEILGRLDNIPGQVIFADYYLHGDGDTVAYDKETGFVNYWGAGGDYCGITWGSLLEFVEEHVIVKQTYGEHSRHNWLEEPNTTTGPAGETRAFDAVWRNDDDLLSELIEQGIDLNQRDVLDRTVAHHLCRDLALGADMLKTILSTGVNMNAKDRYGLTPLTLASRTGFLEAIEVLLNAGADPTITDNAGNRPRDVVCRFWNTNTIRQLLDEGGP